MIGDDKTSVGQQRDVGGTLAAEDVVVADNNVTDYVDLDIGTDGSKNVRHIQTSLCKRCNRYPSTLSPRTDADARKKLNAMVVILPCGVRPQTKRLCHVDDNRPTVRPAVPLGDSAPLSNRFRQDGSACGLTEAPTAVDPRPGAARVPHPPAPRSRMSIQAAQVGHWIW